VSVTGVSPGVLRAAVHAASLSDSEYFPTGAVVFKGRRVLGTGRNFTTKTHPKSRTRRQAIHAELDLERRSDLSGRSVLVVRLLSSGGLGLAKPCLHCERLLREAKVEEVYYSDREGGIQRYEP